MATPADGYCTVEDLLLRPDIPLPREFDKQKYINAAAEEIDSKIGRLYQTPVIIRVEDSEKYRTTIIALRRINSQLATGRIIMTISTTTESQEVDAYGYYLIKDALQSIDDILNRDFILDGAEPSRSLPTDYTVSKSHIYNLDDTSSVEAFYDLVNPSRGNQPVFRGRFIPGPMGG